MTHVAQRLRRAHQSTDHQNKLWTSALHSQPCPLFDMLKTPSGSTFQNPAGKNGTETDVILELGDGNLVRAYRDEDVPSLAYHGNNKRIWDNLRDRMPHPYTKADAKWWIKHCRSTPVKSGPWTLERGSEGPLVTANYAIVVDGQAVGAIGKYELHSEKRATLSLDVILRDIGELLTARD